MIVLSIICIIVVSSSCSARTSGTEIPAEGLIDASARDGGRPRARLDRRGVIAVVALFAVTFVFAAQLPGSTGPADSQQQAVATAQRQVGFTPERTQVRLVRQGLNAHPYWAVSFSVPGPNGSFKRLTTVRIDGNTGAVAAVNRDQR